MNICGIIVEYNPFHNGHLYHLKKCKDITGCEGVIAIMSGSFSQRGTPSIIDKWLKTKLALEHGVDLVLELPSIYSLSSAEFFAFGSISLLNSLGIVDDVCFGSECGDINALINLSNILLMEPPEFKISLKKHLNLGLSYPVARNNALKDYLSNIKNIDEDTISVIFNQSNNILGIEYCKSLLKLNSSIKPFTIQRIGGLYNDLNLNTEFSSATAIRNHLNSKKPIENLKGFIPNKVLDLFINLENINYNFPLEDNMLPFIKYKILTNKNAISNIPDISEGLDNKIQQEILLAKSMNDLIYKVKSKRYTYTRINRVLSQFFIGFEGYPIELMRKAPCPYARVLGFNKTGQKMLKLIKNNCSIPVYTKLPKILNKTLELDIQCTNAYSIINKNIRPYSDYYRSPIII